MTGPVAALLPCGTRLHLQHGPIDLVIGADGDRDGAFRAARTAFGDVLETLVAELPFLRRPVVAGPCPLRGPVARAMWRAATPCSGGFVTPMAAVAGAVADYVLGAMLASVPLTRAYVNNGGDIALHLEPGSRFTTSIATLDGRETGRIALSGRDGIGGIATSGRGGRSLSLGIADSVTVLARNAARADVAATLIANAVDLPGHPAVTRRPARDVQPDSDLGDRPVTVACGPLPPSDIALALDGGRVAARQMIRRGLIAAAALQLQAEVCVVDPAGAITTEAKRTAAHA